MLPISAEFNNSITAQTRQFKARVEITWTDPDIDATIQVTTNSRGYISWLEQVTDTREEPAYKFAALDGSTLLDGSFHPLPSTEEEAKKYQLGWWSAQVAGTGGLFTAPYPRVTVRFVPRTVFGLKVIGDKQKEEFPVDFEIRLYNNEGLVYTETVTGNTEIHWEKGISGENLFDVSRMELEISRWSHSGRVAKIAEFYTSFVQVYDDGDIISLSVLEEREISKGSLPIGNISSNELDLRLININDRFNEGNIYSQYHNMMKPNRKIRVWLGPVLESGLVEYQPLGTFWTQEWDVPETDLYADTSARDRMQRLDESTYNCALYNNTNLYDRVVHILQDAGLEPSEYWVDEALQNETVEWFWIKPCSHREALRQVVERALAQAYSSRKGILRIEGIDFIKMPEQED